MRTCRCSMAPRISVRRQIAQIPHDPARVPEQVEIAARSDKRDAEHAGAIGRLHTDDGILNDGTRDAARVQTPGTGRKTSGSGFPRVTSTPVTTTSNRSLTCS